MKSLFLLTDGHSKGPWSWPRVRPGKILRELVGLKTGFHELREHESVNKQIHCRSDSSRLCHKLSVCMEGNIVSVP